MNSAHNRFVKLPLASGIGQFAISLKIVGLHFRSTEDQVNYIAEIKIERIVCATKLDNETKGNYAIRGM